MNSAQLIYKKRLFLTTLLACGAFLLAPKQAQADELVWSLLSGGDFNTASNWTNLTAAEKSPDEIDNVIFSISPFPSTQTIDFSAGATVSKVHILSNDNLTLTGLGIRDALQALTIVNNGTTQTISPMAAGVRFHLRDVAPGDTFISATGQEREIISVNAGLNSFEVSSGPGLSTAVGASIERRFAFTDDFIIGSNKVFGGQVFNGAGSLTLNRDMVLFFEGSAADPLVVGDTRPGTLILDGARIKRTNAASGTGIIDVGDSSTGTLTVKNGSTINVGQIRVADSSSGTGIVTIGGSTGDLDGDGDVDGADVLMVTGDLGMTGVLPEDINGDMVVDLQDYNQIVVNSLKSEVDLAAMRIGTSGSGTVTVGRNGTLDVSGTIQFGGTTASLTVEDGGDVTSGAVILGDFDGGGDPIGAILNVGGIGSTFAASGNNVIVGETGAGFLSVGSSASFSLTDGDFRIGSLVTGPGIVTVGGGASFVVSGTATQLGGGSSDADLAVGELGAGTLLADSTGTMSVAGDLYVAKDGITVGVFTLSEPSGSVEFDVAGDAYFSADSTGSGGISLVSVNTGAVLDIEGSLNVATDTGGGTATLTIEDSGSEVEVMGSTTIGAASGSTATVSVEDSGVLDVEGSVTIEDTGTLAGDGTVEAAGGIILAGGTIDPGLSIGTINLTGNLSGTGTLDIELDGPSSADVVAITGNVNLTNITIDVLDGGTDPLVNDEFIVLTYSGTRTGTPTLGTDPFAGITFNIDVATSGQVKLVAVSNPEPSTYFILGSSLLVAGYCRRRRDRKA